MSGLDGLRYLSSSSDSTGGATVELTFEPGTDPDIAQVQVQNKLQLAMPQLPQEVQRQGVRVAKSNRNFLMIAAFVSTDGSMQRNDISDYVRSTLQDPISRVPGVGDLQVFGTQYAMRIWLDPDKLAGLRMTPLDVRDAILAQNAQVSAGQFGGAPAVPGQQLNATITAQTRLQTPDQFEAILLRVNPNGSQVRLRDVARVELAGESFEIESFFNGAPTSGIGIRLAVGANALATSAAVKARLVELSSTFPPGLEVRYPVDTTPFVRISIEEVVKTLLEAIGLVFLVMLLFLQSFRATLIPTLAVPVVLLGTFGVLAAFGYSINTLTMFGMVLAIGLLVDDAIVVVENVERVMQEEGLSPKEATRKSMKQITGALVGIGMVLSAVFIPMAFFGGSVGVIYRQFAITIISAMALSVVVALTLSPALCATILKAGHATKRKGLFGLFNRGYDRTNHGYGRLVGLLVRRRFAALIVYAVLGGGLALVFGRMPAGFLPEEDQGLFNVQVLAPPGATQEMTRAIMDRVSEHLLTEEGEAVESVMAITGFAFGGRGQNTGLAFVRLKPWDERAAPRLAAKAVDRARDPGVRPVQGRDGVRVRAAGDQRARQRQRLPAPAPGSRRGRARGAAGRARSAAGARGDAPGADQGEAGRARGPAGVQDRRRSGEGRRARALARRHQHHAVGDLGRRVRQRLHRRRAHQARVHPGRRALPHAARGSRALVRAEPDRRDGRVLGVRDRPLDLRLAEARSVQRLPDDRDPG